MAHRGRVPLPLSQEFSTNLAHRLAYGIIASPSSVYVGSGPIKRISSRVHCERDLIHCTGDTYVNTLLQKHHQYSHLDLQHYITAEHETYPSYLVFNRHVVDLDRELVQ